MDRTGEDRVQEVNLWRRSQFVTSSELKIDNQIIENWS
jgi:hypothetical protein